MITDPRSGLVDVLGEDVLIAEDRVDLCAVGLRKLCINLTPVMVELNEVGELLEEGLFGYFLGVTFSHLHVVGLDHLIEFKKSVFGGEDENLVEMDLRGGESVLKVARGVKVLSRGGVVKFVCGARDDADGVCVC